MNTTSAAFTIDFDILIIGGGVIGLSIAHTLSARYSVLLVEQHSHLGAETSSRNSEVIHAGLYYPADSLKESLCVSGKHQLYEFCEQHDVPFQRTGKLIVSPFRDHPRLQQLEGTAQRLGIPVERLDQSELYQLEPQVSGQEALLSPSTGVIDSHTYLQRLEQHASANGALVVCQTQYSGITEYPSHWCVALDSPDGTTHIRTRAIINAAGLNANKVAADFGVRIAQSPLYPCRGHYFSYSGSSPFRHLVYPLPEDNLAGLGVHATLDLGGGLRFGPDTRYLDQCELASDQYRYSVANSLRDAFAKAIQRYFPNLDANRLQPDYSGIRPKLHHGSQSARDFEIILGPNHRPPSLHLLGIESPGLTASLAIAEHAARRLSESFT